MHGTLIYYKDKQHLFFGFSAECIYITTDDESNASGDIEVQVNGNTVVSGHYNRNENVLNQCFDSIYAIEIRGISAESDDWMGSIR